jgi:hypothetical protein
MIPIIGAAAVLLFNSQTIQAQDGATNLEQAWEAERGLCPQRKCVES